MSRDFYTSIVIVVGVAQWLGRQILFVDFPRSTPDLWLII